MCPLFFKSTLRLSSEFALFSGYLCLTAFWHSEQRIYKAYYEKTKDKYTVTTDEPRYQLARENNKMSQVNNLVAMCDRPLLLPTVRSTRPPGAWGRRQTCWWSPSHGCVFQRDKFLSPSDSASVRSLSVFLYCTGYCKQSHSNSSLNALLSEQDPPWSVPRERRCNLSFTDD